MFGGRITIYFENNKREAIKQMIRGLGKIINLALSPSGYEIRRKRALLKTSHYTLCRYLKPDGSFDYEKYRQIQTEGNRRKIERTWAIEGNIAFLADFIGKIYPNPRFGICHGSRRGDEQTWFAKYLQDCIVIGTDISDTASQFNNTIQWDFHEAKPEWIDSVDFIYSNAFDHSYDPEKCLKTWMSCLRKGGLCIIEHTSGHVSSTATELDPFGVDLEVLPYLIMRWAKGKYGIREIVEAPERHAETDFSYFIILQKW